MTAEIARAAQAYRASMQQLLTDQEARVQQGAAAVEDWRQLRALGAVDASYVAEAERALAVAQRHRDELRVAVEAADRMFLEVSVQQRIAGLPPLARGGYDDGPTMVRFNGTAAWSLRNVGALQQRFVEAFGRALPISAFGQTTLHDRFGLDHRAAIDVALHPDSTEGRWLIQYLRQAGFPFIAIRAAVPGASTGAHIHVGLESSRLLAR